MALVEIREVSCSACRPILANHNHAMTGVITPEKHILNQKENVKYKAYTIMNEHLMIKQKHKMEKTKLIKVSTYARQEGISVPAVYKRINAGSVECVEIDGVKFIKVNNDGKH